LRIPSSVDGSISDSPAATRRIVSRTVCRSASLVRYPAAPAMT
jgi:hypothetical protein